MIEALAPILSAGEQPASLLDMSDFPKHTYSKSQIIAAGKAIRAGLPMGDEAIEAFRIAHSWRSAHVYPMLSMRSELSRCLKQHDIHGLTAARLKRMKSIIRKLRGDTPYTLYQIQDIGGCRAIVDSIGDVRKTIKHFLATTRHNFNKPNDYILAPKVTGYRSHHLMMKFIPDEENKEEERFSRQIIEIQVRTRLQHAWATAVEAVGL
jgi:Uncharacterized protein conserved in bacteria